MNFEKYCEMIDKEAIQVGYKIEMLRNIYNNNNKFRSNIVDAFLFGVIIVWQQARSRVIYKTRLEINKKAASIYLKLLAE